ncbi:MAG: hypothetical protein BWX93_01857 [Bacteroidetes bacterium ADurb.Bin139]|nr:MAG: hypothetical protein BWX93_01857 [Bacteroidetes bacterium ADurb.Bin139]
MDDRRQEKQNSINQAYQDYFNIEIGCKSGTYAAQDLVVQVAIQFFGRPWTIPVSTRSRAHVCAFFFNHLYRAHDIQDIVNIGFGDNTAIHAGAFRQQFGYAFLNTVHNLRPAFPARIIPPQVVQVHFQHTVGILCQGKGDFVYANFDYFFHFLRISIVSTISFQALSISRNTSRPLLVSE